MFTNRYIVSQEKLRGENFACCQESPKEGTVENAVCELSVWEPVYRSFAGLTNGQWDTVSLSPLPPALRLESPASVSLTEIRTYSPPSPPLTLTLHRDSCVFKEITYIYIYTCFEELKKDRKKIVHINRIKFIQPTFWSDKIKQVFSC